MPLIPSFLTRHPYPPSPGQGACRVPIWASLNVGPVFFEALHLARILPLHLVRSLLRRNHAQPICLSHIRMPRNPKPIIVAAFSFPLSVFYMTPIYPHIANYCSCQPFGRFGLRAWGFVFCAPFPTSPCSRAESALHAGALAAPRRSLGSKAQKTGLIGLII